MKGISTPTCYVTMTDNYRYLVPLARAMLTKAFPSSGPSSNGSTIMDMGSAHGGTARIAAKEFGCNVSKAG